MSDDLRVTLTRLIRPLWRYMKHNPDCACLHGKEMLPSCDCGLSEASRPFREAESDVIYYHLDPVTPPPEAHAALRGTGEKGGAT